MKHLRSLTALLALLGLLALSWAPVTVSATASDPVAVAATPQAEELFYFGRSVLAKMDNGEALCYAYDKLVAGCGTVSDYVDISHRTHRINYDEASLVYRTVLADHPELFWLADGISMSGSTNRITAFAPYVYDGIAEEQAALNARVTALTVDLKGKSEAEISRILHDRICEITVYRGSTYDQTVIGSLLQGQAVCAGYARGYQLLMQTMGIPTFCVTGYSKNQAHAWNLVQLDGAWYYTDVTWDDQNDNGGNVYYAYLNLTYDRMAEDHVAEIFVEYLPRSTATTANYHYQNGSAMDNWDADHLAACYEMGKPLRVYVTGDMSAFIADVNIHLGDLVNLVACPYSGYSCGLSYLGREIWISLTVSKPHTYDGNTCSNCGYTRPGAVLLGDADGNGKVNNRDLGLLQKHLNEWDVTVDMAACDVNSDGKINNRDLGALQRMLNE